MAKATPCKDALAKWAAAHGGGEPLESVEKVELCGLCPPIEKMDSSLSALRACRHLSLSTNNLDKIGNLAGLDALQVLSLGRNCLKKLENLEAVAGTLQQLWISYNQVDRLAGIEKCASLRVLYASNNKLKDWAEVERLSGLPHLEDLLLIGNPLYNEWKDNGALPQYRIELTYFKGSKLVRTGELDPSRRYIWVAHPHGLLGNSFFLAFCTDLLGFSKLFPGIRLTIGVLSLNLKVSFCREICLLHGLCDVDRPTLLARLRQGPGSSVLLAVGGASESLLTQNGCLDLILNKRRGFVKLALEAGADLVPVISFGENECYERPPVIPGSLADRMQRATKKICGFNVPRGHGRGVLSMQSGPLPERIPLIVVVGAPLRLPEFKGDLRSEEGRAHVDKCHAMYCDALRSLYDTHKDAYAPNRKRDMRLVE
ncbi:Diacylglycerol O-acyltransferase 2B [Micractinium conductrix]|uniref:Acyltransferase n=1 Tax=Micractinium conductrix TaxID=554055 RepID=A0A2P6VB84_9CHLO|nr:Diacylglycerol O-acyltransferase 2B [Micractinium conductrix]|eukprot:PSC71349.1 Diacylglycerol O-acyltransferase 2B [Micractinium conductrix]